MPKALRILGYVLTAIIILLSAGGAYLWMNKDRIIAGGIEKINTQLRAPVSVGTVDLDLFSGFPRVRIALDQVRIENSLGGATPLLEVQRVGLGMNLLEVLRGTYTIEELVLEEGTLALEESTAGSNWDLFQSNEEQADPLALDHVILQHMAISYRSAPKEIDYSGYAQQLIISGSIDATTQLRIKGELQNNSVDFERERWCQELDLEGTLDLTMDNDSWSVQTQRTHLQGIPTEGTITHQSIALSTRSSDLSVLLPKLPFLLIDGVTVEKLVAPLTWSGSYDKWTLGLDVQDASLAYNEIAAPKIQGQLTLEWGDSPALHMDGLLLQTQTGELNGSLALEGQQPTLQVQVSGGSNLSELFQFVEVETLENPMGFWQGEDLTYSQRFKSWSDFSPSSDPDFGGTIHLTKVAFGLAESNIEFEKVEADLVVANGNIRLERCYAQSGMNNVVASGNVLNVFGGRPQVKLDVESPTIVVDPILYWEFEDDGESNDDYGFDFEVNLDIDALTLGEFEGTDLRCVVYNRGTKILGRDMVIQACSGQFSGNWALAEEAGGSRFWSRARCESIELDELLQSFDSFDIDDLDESNLKGTATADLEMTFHFDHNWEVRSERTAVDANAQVRNGRLTQYKPLEELSAFIDRGELADISFPYLQGPFYVRGDTLFIPETEVKNSAINLWVNGWQNMKDDAISYSIKLGLKDLALRGRNSNRDLGSWVSEAENDKQPYLRLLVGCDLEDPCISLDRQRIKSSIKQSIQKEKEDLRTLFKKDEDEPKDDPSSGTFELLWPEQDSLRVRNWQ